MHCSLNVFRLLPEEYLMMFSRFV